ncbi:MAG TPA: ABC transporter permease [Thermoleophilaceae bacterium]|nr:ABC transporter permease [Thermoleophilaceae bacterium]
MRFRELSTVAILAVVFAVFASLAPQLLEPGTIKTILRQVAPVAIAGAAITLVMIAGSLDLSVGGTIALSGVVCASLAAGETPVATAFLAGVAVGGAIGAVNAGLVVGLRISSVIATLGMLFVARGIAFIISDGRPQSVIPDAESFSAPGNGTWLGVPNPAWIMLVLVVGFWFLQRHTKVGRYAVAIGSNESAARLSGIRVDRVRALLFVAAGLAAGVSGVILAGQFNGDPKIVEEGWEFAVIVAAVLGGTSLAGGQGSVVGTLIGALIVGVIASGLNILGVDRFWQFVVQGGVLVAVVAIDDRIGPLRSRLRERGRRAERAPPAAGEASA